MAINNIVLAMITRHANSLCSGLLGCGLLIGGGWCHARLAAPPALSTIATFEMPGARTGCCGAVNTRRALAIRRPLLGTAMI